MIGVSEKREKGKEGLLPGEAVEEIVNSSETDLAAVVNAWYSAGFYTGRQVFFFWLSYLLLHFSSSATSKSVAHIFIYIYIYTERERGRYIREKG